MPRGLGEEGTVALRALSAFKGSRSDGRLSEGFGDSGHPNPQPAGSKTLVVTPRREVGADARSPSYLPRAESSDVFPCMGPGSGFGGSEATAVGLC